MNIRKKKLLYTKQEKVKVSSKKILDVYKTIYRITTQIQSNLFRYKTRNYTYVCV